MTLQNPRSILWAPLLCLVLSALLYTGCADRQALTPDEYRARLPALQERVEAEPEDAGAFRELGEAFAQIGEFDRAYEALRQSESLDSQDPRTYYYLGLTEEARGNLSEALARYQDAPRSSPYWGQMATRAALLSRRVAREDIAALLDRDAYPDVADVQDAVVVFPFDYRGADPVYRPLARGLSELLATDLAVHAQVRVLNGPAVDALMDELGLQPSDLDAARAERLGLLLRTRHAMVGTLSVDDGAVRTEAILVTQERVNSPEARAVMGPLSDLFRLEKELVAELAQALGVPLSESEQERLDQTPTHDLQAFLLYSRGLLEEDAGRFAAAAALYSEAASLDPGFLAAAERAGEAGTLASVTPGVDEALALFPAHDGEPRSPELMSGRLAALTRTLNAYLAPGEGARDPATEVAPPSPAVAPFPAPPPPPTTGGN